MLVQVLSPLRASAVRTADMHREFAKLLCRTVSLAGEEPFAPHVFATQFLDDTIPEEREAGIRISLAVIARSDEVWVWDAWGISSGMAAEIEVAKKHGKRIKFVSIAGEIPAWEDLYERYGRAA